MRLSKLPAQHWPAGLLGLVLLAALSGGCSDGAQSSSGGSGGSGGSASTGGGGTGGGAGSTSATGGGGAGGGGTVTPAACLQGATFYLSPGGSDAADGTTSATPWKSFEHAFSTMVSGDQLVLLDGTYGEAAGTGTIGVGGGGAAQPPSGESLDKMTCVSAENPGQVRVGGPLVLGSAAEKAQFLAVSGVTFDGGALVNTDHVAVRSCGFHSETQGAGAVLGVGTNDGEWGNTNVLLEDIWVWGKERVGLIVYRSDHVVVRRAIVRVDGCDSHQSGCGDNSGNSMVGTTIYNAHHVALENVLVLDSLLGPGGYAGAADLQTAWHDNYFYPFGANRWIGCMSIGSELGGMNLEIDGDIGEGFQPFFDVRDVAVAAGAFGFNTQAQATLGATSMRVDGLTVVNAGADDAVRVGPEYGAMVDSHVRDVVAAGEGRFGINSAISPDHVDVGGAFSDGAYNQTSCSEVCLSVDPLAGPTPALRYLPRIEAGSALSGAGSAGADIGANVTRRVGKEGSFHGDAEFEQETADALWPWPNQARIQKEMCSDSGVTRGFCGAPNLSRYVWEYLGSPCPDGVCE